MYSMSVEAYVSKPFFYLRNVRMREIHNFVILCACAFSFKHCLLIDATSCACQNAFRQVSNFNNNSLY